MNLLIVDDTPTNLKLLRAQLEAEGHAVFEAHDGVDALALLERQCVEVVITDILMPRMDGYRLCYEIRKHARLHDLPIILYTSTYTSPSDEKLALDVSADKYLKKPASVETLVAALHEVIAIPPAARQPKALQEVEVLKEYNERLVFKLEEKNTELVAAEVKFRALVEQSIVGIYIIQDDQFVYVNPRMAGIFGRSEAELTSRTLYDFIVPEDHAVMRENIRQQISGVVPSIHYYQRMLHQSGAVLQVEIHANWTDYHGRPAVMGTLLDITDRERAEESLRASEEKFRGLFESSRDAIMTLEAPSWRFTSGNPATVKMFAAKNEEEFISLGPWELSPEQQPDGRASAEQAREMIETAMREGSHFFEWTHRRIGGEEFPAIVLLTRMEQGKKVILQATVRDNSEHHRAEVSLHEARVFADTVIESVSGLFYVLDQDGIFVRWNQSMQELLGLSSDQMRRTHALSVVHEADRERIAGKIADIFASGHVEAEAQLLTKDGVLHVLLNGRRLDIAGVVYLVGSGADITAHKQAQEQITFLNQSLEQRVRDRTAELSFANSDLAKASQTKSEFLATMSHELRTPLNGVLGMNELLLTTELSDRQRQYVEVCNSSGKILVQLINDILDLSKIEAGKLELDPRECDLESLVYDVVGIMSHAVQKKGLALTCQLAPEACVVGLFDDNRLRQVLVNLVGNATKFTSYGGITITVDRVAERDRIACLRFTVTDTGVGIPKERLDRLFKAFSQVDSSTTRRFGGTGLGLSICKQLIALMGGEIGVESQVGIGTMFWFEIEIVTTGDTAAERRRRLLAGTRIIAIDGLDLEQRQLGDDLRSWDCLFQQVATVEEALAAAQSAAAEGIPVRVVLMDCRLATGNKFVQFQKLAALPDLHIIGLGILPDALSRDHLYGLGVKHMLPDPVRPSALFNALVSVLSVTNGTASYEEDRPTLLQQPVLKLSGHILVAEDNRINQLYIVELLKHFGCTSDVVVNGEEVLAAVQQQRYDLVLMDCQMPEMDGFTATGEIRKREAAGQLPGRLPIIALTANALKGDRERCLDVGMDEYVSKPVEGAQLKAVLENILGRTSPPPRTAGEGI